MVITTPTESLFLHELSIELVSRNSITRHPIDGAVDVTDHIQREPDEVSVTAVVTDSPLRLSSSAGLSPTQEAERFLEAASGQRLSLFVSGWPTLTSYALANWSRPKSHVRALRYTMRFTQIRVARSQTVRIPASRTGSAGAPDKQELGPMEGVEPRGSALFDALSRANRFRRR